MNKSALFSSTYLTGVTINGNGRQHTKRSHAPKTKPRQLHRTTGRERRHRDFGFAHPTKVAERNAAGEIPD